MCRAMTEERMMRIHHRKQQQNHYYGLWIPLGALSLLTLVLLLRSISDTNIGHLRQPPPQQEVPYVTQHSLPFDLHLAKQCTELIIVAGHSVVISGHLHDAQVDENDWYLLDYQKHQGLPQAIVAHIVAGIQAAADAGEQSLLMFSGGATRLQTGPDTEAASYFRVSDALQLWTLSVRSRTVTEDYARDSFENVLFSIARFYEVTQRFPKKITVVSFTYKRNRFVTLHAPALRLPDTLEFIGIDPPPSTGFDLVSATKGEMENAAQPFVDDPYGCHSKVLQDKRASRNPFARVPPYTLSCPPLKHLLDYCGPEIIDASLVPW